MSSGHDRVERRDYFPEGLREGLFLTPGKEPEKLWLCTSGQVKFQGSTGDCCEPHGNWHPWATTSEMDILTITFNYKGSEAPRDLVAHTFVQLFPGVYRTPDQ